MQLLRPLISKPVEEVLEVATDLAKPPHDQALKPQTTQLVLDLGLPVVEQNVEILRFLLVLPLGPRRSPVHRPPVVALVCSHVIRATVPRFGVAEHLELHNRGRAPP